MTERALVLDIETALDRDAVERARRTGPTAFLRSWLHRIVAASTLGFTLDPGALRFDGFALDTALATNPADEPALLDFVETRLAHLGDAGVLITFNGMQHDVPVLVHRRLHHWLFAPSCTAHFAAGAGGRHEDVMLRLSEQGTQRWPALVDVCAALDIPCDPNLRPRQGPRLDPFLVKGQTDVVATFLLHCLGATQAAGSHDLLVQGWTALADYLLLRFPTQPHLTQFATAPMALVAREKAQPGA